MLSSGWLVHEAHCGYIYSSGCTDLTARVQFLQFYGHIKTLPTHHVKTVNCCHLQVAPPPLNILLLYSQARPHRPTPNTAATKLNALLWVAHKHAETALQTQISSLWQQASHDWSLKTELTHSGGRRRPAQRGNTRGNDFGPLLVFPFVICSAFPKPHNHLTGIRAPAATSFRRNIALLCAELVVKVSCVDYTVYLQSQNKRKKKKRKSHKQYKHLFKCANVCKSK